MNIYPGSRDPGDYQSGGQPSTKKVVGKTAGENQPVLVLLPAGMAFRRGGHLRPFSQAAELMARPRAAVIHPVLSVGAGVRRVKVAASPGPLTLQQHLP